MDLMSSEQLCLIPVRWLYEKCKISSLRDKILKLIDPFNWSDKEITGSEAFSKMH